MVKVRIFEESNYKSIWHKGKTIRIALDPNKPITELKYPEFYDVKLTSYCRGKCPWCYMDSKDSDKHYQNIPKRILEYFEPMTENQRPFQVALGGGEPTEHPEFIQILKTFDDLGIVPNYTTNGMWVDKDIMTISDLADATKKYCGGVAVSCHPHLKSYWQGAAKYYSDWGVKLNFHNIISDKKSIDDFISIYNEWKEKVDYFVLLPYGSQGRATEKDIEWEYLIENLPEDHGKIAFGANFYPYLMRGNHDIKISLYEPEIMSKFIDMKDMSIYPSSFNLTKKCKKV